MVLRAFADLFVAHEIPATQLMLVGVIIRDYSVPVMMLVGVNTKHSGAVDPKSTSFGQPTRGDRADMILEEILEDLIDMLHCRC